GGVEVRQPGGGDVERAALEGGEALRYEPLAAVDQPRFLRPIGQRATRDVVVVGFVRLAEVGGIGVGDGTLFTHPADGGAGVQAAREGNANLFPFGDAIQDLAHVSPGRL